MSVPHFGRITPLQGDMLELGGLLLINLDGHTPTDEERIGIMKAAQVRLCKSTNCDFGYDMQAWHTYLQEDTNHRGEYKHPYAWRAVRLKITELIDDPDRIRLARIIESSV